MIFFFSFCSLANDVTQLIIYIDSLIYLLLNHISPLKKKKKKQKKKTIPLQHCIYNTLALPVKGIIIMDQRELLATDVLASLASKCDIRSLINHPINYSRIIKVAEEYMSVDQFKFYHHIGDRLCSNNNSSSSSSSFSPSPPSSFFDVRDNIYMISGLPGTGKSFLQSVIHLFCLVLGNKDILCLAPTNLIAYQQKGKTIHSQIKDILRLLSISSGRDVELTLANLLVDKYHIVKSFDELRKMSLTELTKAISQLARTNGFITKLNAMAEQSSTMIILMDEGTMVSSLLFAVLFLRFPKAVFIIMYGPNQLPPISGGLKLPDCEYAIKQDNCEHIYTLDTQLRFINDDRINLNNDADADVDADLANINIFIEFVKYFSATLSGELCNSSNETKLNKVNYFLKNLKIGGTLIDYHKLGHSDRILIVNTNKQRIYENNQRLMAEGEGPIYSIDAIIPEELPSTYNLESQMGIDKVLRIRKGVTCMLKVNDLYRGLIKGMLVKVGDIQCTTDDNYHDVVTKIDITVMETGKKISLGMFKLETNFLKNPKDESSVVYIHQFPITLAYSLTAYSSQGKTLDCDIGIDLKSQFSSSNLVNAVFVAITRVRNPSQLFMNEHPVYWLEPSMNICNLDDFERLKQRIISLSHPTTIPSLTKSPSSPSPPPPPRPPPRWKPDIDIFNLNQIIQYIHRN